MDIFWVVGWYWGLSWVSSFPVWMAYSANDNDIYNQHYWSNDIRFYESWWIIYCMWCVSAYIEWWLPWRSFYYLEIRKSDLAVVKRSHYQWYSPETYYINTWTYMSIQNIWWTDRFCFCCNTLSTSRWLRVYFDWSNLVEWWSTWTSIWEVDYNINNWTSIEAIDATYPNTYDFYQPWFTTWVWQTFVATSSDSLEAIEVITRTDWWTIWSTISCEIRSWAFWTLIWTSDSIPWADFEWTAYTKHTFRFSWINLNIWDTYSFKILWAIANPWSWELRITVWNWTLSWWNFYDNGSSKSSVDMWFKMYFWTYVWKLTWSVIIRDVQDSYNDYWCATWFLDFS